MAKTQANRQLYISILRRMTPEKRLAKAFELTAMVRELGRAGIANRHPELEADEVARMARDRLIAWHKKNS